MTRRSQLRLIYHGAIFMVTSMLLETPGLLVAFHRLSEDPLRQTLRQSHAILMATGIFMIASSAILPLLELVARDVSLLVWSFVVSGYTFIAALLIVVPGFLCHPPDKTLNQWEQAMTLPLHLGWLNVGLIGLSGAASAVPGFVILFGAYKSLQHSPLDNLH